MQTRYNSKSKHLGVTPPSPSHSLSRASRSTALNCRKTSRAHTSLAYASFLCLAVVGTLLGTSSCGAIERVTEAAKGTPKVRTVKMYTTEPNVRVRIHSAVPKVTIDGVPTLVVRPKTVGSTVGRAESMAAPLVITSSRNGLIFTDPKGKKVQWPAGQDAEILPTASEGTSVRIDGVNYPGFAIVSSKADGNATTMDVIVDMPIEAYIPGVLSHELWKDWPRQTYECQAVAARSYAVHERERSRREGKPFDLEDTTADQVFGGTTKLRMPMETAQATRGLILTWRGEVLRAYYSSQCGGRSASAAAVWSTSQRFEFNEAEPIQGKPRPHYCQRSPRYRWEVTRPDDDVNQRLRAYGRMRNTDLQNVTRVRKIEINERNDADRPNTYTVTDDRDREYIVRAEDLRAALNHAVKGLPAITPETIVHSGDLEAEVWANTVRFRGRGWGHGVGMCQWCAKGMADAGMDWASMIKTFYPEAEVVKAW